MENDDEKIKMRDQQLKRRHQKQFERETCGGKRGMPFADNIIFPAYTPTTRSPDDGSNKMDSWRFPGSKDDASVFFLYVHYVKSYLYPIYLVANFDRTPTSYIIFVTKLNIDQIYNN